MNFLDRIQKDYGTLILADGKPYDYEGENTGEGYVYKDYEAFKTGEGICYISEYGLEELHEELADLEARYLNTEMSVEDYEAERDEILACCGETRQTIIAMVQEVFGDDYLMTAEQVEYFAEDVFQLAEWAYISTYLQENFDIDDCIEYDHEKGTGRFSEQQYQAVMAGMTPKEYQESLAR